MSKLSAKFTLYQHLLVDAGMKPSKVVAFTKGEPFPQPKRNDGGEPCGECHLSHGETCDICGASRNSA